MTLSVWFVHADHEGLLCCTLFSLVNFIFPVFRYIVKALSQICSSATAPFCVGAFGYLLLRINIYSDERRIMTGEPVD